MIISERHKFIFAAIPKTGTHAVRRALRDHLGEEDSEQVGLFVSKSLPFPELARIKHGHLSFEQVRPFLGEKFDRFFKFAFVRNPYDRFVSYCAFMTRQDRQFERSPAAVMRQIIANPPWRHILFRPQYEQLVDQQGALLTDDIGRFETMQESYDRIAERLGLPSTPLERVNESDHRDYRTYYTQELKDGVARLYARDFELFGYQV